MKDAIKTRKKKFITKKESKLVMTKNIREKVMILQENHTFHNNLLYILQENTNEMFEVVGKKCNLEHTPITCVAYFDETEMLKKT